MAEVYAVGIDLGTSTSEICIYKDGRAFPIPDPATKTPICPSIVALDKRDSLLVGEDARPYMHIPGRALREAKREMGKGAKLVLGDNEYSPEEISSFILRMLKENLKTALGIEASQVVLSVPSNFPDAAKNATKIAGELAGLEVIRLMSEPTAAALAFGIEHLDADENVLVFDFGGGTLDISILEMVGGILDVRCSYGDPELGGKDFDTILAELILSRFKEENPIAVPSEQSLRDLKRISEQVKIALSRQEYHESVLANFAVIDGIPVDLEIEISRSDFEKASSSLLEKARQCLQATLDIAGTKPQEIDRVLLVGGTTYMPCIRDLVSEDLEREIRSDVDPDLAVSIGACIQAAIIKDMISPEDGLILADVCPYGLGIRVVDFVGDQLMELYDPLIAPNTKIPYSINKGDYSLLTPDQDTLEIRLYQDHNKNPKRIEDATDTGYYRVITDIPLSSSGIPHPVGVEFSIDINGMIDLKATIPTTGQSVELFIRDSKIRMSDSEKKMALERTQELWEKSSRAKEYEAIINKATRVIQAVSEKEAERLMGALQELKDAIAGGDEQITKGAEDKIIDILYDMESNKSEE